MKKLYFIPILLTAVMTVLFTSCDEDTDIAYTLEGTWQGDMQISTEWEGRVYDVAYSEICFVGDPYRRSSGTGYWVDHYNVSPWSYQDVANQIRWQVINGRILVDFWEEGTHVEISDYALNGDYFTGTIYDQGNVVDFRLRRVASPNWNNYYYYGSDYYGAKSAPDVTRGAADSVTKPVRRFGLKR